MSLLLVLDRALLLGLVFAPQRRCFCSSHWWRGKQRLDSVRLNALLFCLLWLSSQAALVMLASQIICDHDVSLVSLGWCWLLVFPVLSQLARDLGCIGVCLPCSFVVTTWWSARGAAAASSGNHGLLLCYVPSLHRNVPLLYVLYGLKFSNSVKKFLPQQHILRKMLQIYSNLLKERKNITS